MADPEPLSPRQLALLHANEITEADAEAFHRSHWSNGTLVIWCITTNTRDFGTRYVARPILAPELNPRLENGYLIADTLDDIRKKLPQGVTRMDRHPTDPPQIVETWF